MEVLTEDNLKVKREWQGQKFSFLSKRGSYEIRIKFYELIFFFQSLLKELIESN